MVIFILMSSFLYFYYDDAHSRDKWRNLTTGNRPTLRQCDNEGVIRYGLRSRDVMTAQQDLSNIGTYESFLVMCILDNENVKLIIQICVCNQNFKCTKL